MAGINMGAAAPGLGRLAAAIGGGGGRGGGAYQDAYDHELTLQSKLAQALASVQASQESARLHRLQADAEQAQTDARRPENLLGTALTTYGIPAQEAPAVSEYLKTGQLGGKYRMPDDGVGPVAPAPDYAPKLGSVARTLGTMNQAFALGDKNIHNVSQAEDQRRVSGLADGVIAGTVDPTRFAASQYAAKGSAPYSFHEFGTGNNLTGTVDDQNGPAVRFGQYRQAETGNQVAAAGAHRASAASSYASAEHSRALTTKTRQETEQGAKGVLQQTDQGLLLVDPRTGTATPVMGPNGQPAAKPTAPVKPMPSSAVKQQQEELDAIGTASGINADLAALHQQIDNGTLKLGAISNILNQARNGMGMSTEQSRNLASFKSTLEKMRNDSLRMNKGVQTEGDAQRAWNELITNIGDPNLVKQRLKEIQTLNSRAADLHRLNVETLRANFGQPPLDTSNRTSLPPAIGSGAQPGPHRVTSDADYNSLPSGAEFIAPDGSHRRKP